MHSGNDQVLNGLDEQSRDEARPGKQFYKGHIRMTLLGLERGYTSRCERRKSWRFHSLSTLSLLLLFVQYCQLSAWALSHGPADLDATEEMAADTDTFDWGSHTPSKTLNWTDCYGDFQCARLSVPLLYSEPSDGEAAVALIKYPSSYPSGHENYRGPILLNPGGPGSSGVSFVRLGATTFLQDILTDEFDLIGFDPRGVGFTTPALNIFKDQLEYGKFFLQFPGNLNTSDPTFREAYTRADILGSIAEDRAHFVAERVSTPLVARDMRSIVKALGQDKLQYWGISYGTVLGATFAAMFPDDVGRMVLDGVLDAEDYYKGLRSNGIRDADSALMVIYQACVDAGPSQCPIYEKSAALVKARVDRLLDQLKAEPVAFYDSTDTGDTYGVVDYSLVRTVMFGSLYGPYSSGANLLNAIAALERGDPSQFYANSSINLYDAMVQCDCTVPGGSPSLLGAGLDLNVAISCGDAADNRNESFESVRKAYEEMANMSSFADNWPLRAVCSGWKVTAKERFNGSFGQSISTNYPLLLIGNTADPVTPLSSAHKMSKSFKDSVVLTQNSSGHSSLAATSLCTSNAVRTYFVNGTLPEKGTVCEVESSVFRENQVDPGVTSLGNRELMNAAETSLFTRFSTVDESRDSEAHKYSIFLE